MQIGILGGAYNPVTVGHIALAKYVLKNVPGMDQVWLTPCNHHMFGKDMVEPERRLEMCYLAAEYEDNICACSYEIDRNLPGDTYTFVNTIKNDKNYDYYEFKLIIGWDNALGFEKWVKHEELEKMVPFIVVPRNGIDEAPRSQWFMKPPHILIDVKKAGFPTEIPVSSSLVRELIWESRNTPVKDDKNLKIWTKMVDKEVARYIMRNNLYV